MPGNYQRMHSILPQELKVLQSIELQGPIEKAWHLITEPSQMIRWMGTQFHHVEFDPKPGGKINFTGKVDDKKFSRRGSVTDYFAPYHFSYRYKQEITDLHEPTTVVSFSLMVLPRDVTMVYVQQTGFHAGNSFEMATFYWRTVLQHLQQLMQS